MCENSLIKLCCFYNCVKINFFATKVIIILSRTGSVHSEYKKGIISCICVPKYIQTFGQQSKYSQLWTSKHLVNKAYTLSCEQTNIWSTKQILSVVNKQTSGQQSKYSQLWTNKHLVNKANTLSCSQTYSHCNILFLFFMFFHERKLMRAKHL